VAALRAAEELLRSAAAALARIRVRLERMERGGHGSPRSRAVPFLEEIRALARWGRSHASTALGHALAEEAQRWEERALLDPAAARVEQVFRTLLAMLEEPDPSGGAPAARRERSGAHASGRAARIVGAERR
jgi:hypothetical protein